MKILRADAMGMCFGVRDALAVIRQLPEPGQVTVHGELVHNQEVLRELDRRGFHRSPEGSRPLPQTPVVLVTAHGISERERRRLHAADKQLVDTTCPLVQKAHGEAQRLQGIGCRVVVIGKQDHVEVRGIVEDLIDPVVVSAVTDVTTWPEPRLGVVCQTTTQVEVAAALLAAIRRANPHADVQFADTICSPTKARIAALAALLPRIDALVVVGGFNSNNTKQLVRTAEQHGVPTQHVEAASGIDAAWFRGREVVGLTAGTSTLQSTNDEVHAALQAIADGRWQPLANTSRRRQGRPAARG